MAEAFEAKSKILESRMAALGREIRDIDSAIAGIGAAMDSSLVSTLSLHLPAVRRLATLNQRRAALGQQVSAVRGDAIGARARAKLAAGIAGGLASAESRRMSEQDLLETISIMSASSLRQGEDV